MLELVQIKKIDNSYSLSTIFVNPNHIVMLSEHREYSSDLKEGKMNLELNPITVFTKLVVNEGSNSASFVVIGEPSVIESKLNKSFSKRKLLRG